VSFDRIRSCAVAQLAKPRLPSKKILRYAQRPGKPRGILRHVSGVYSPAWRWIVSLRSLVKALALTLTLAGFGGVRSAQAQDWSDYLHWPYVPPQVPGNGFEYKSLHDGFYVYPRNQRIVPQVQGPYYRNYYGGMRILGCRLPHSLFHDWNKNKYYQGYHFYLDVF
jgi:hypothetical protein